MKKNIMSFLILLSGVFTYSQEKTPNKEKEVDEIIDSLFEEDGVLEELAKTIDDFQFLYLSINYNNNTYFSGRDIGIDQYNVRPQMTYMHSKGFMASISGMYYSNFVPRWDFTAATIGYNKNIGKKRIRLYSYYSRYFYSSGVDNPFENALTLGTGIKNKQQTIGTQLSGTYLFGKDESFQISSTIYASFKLLKTNKSTLKLRPELNFVAGKQTFELAQTYILNGVLTTDYLENDIFDLINTQINIPLEFSTNSFDFEFGYNINLPSAIGTESNLKATGFFNFSMAYLFDL